MDLCHEKHSELKLLVKLFKGRVVSEEIKRKMKMVSFRIFRARSIGISHCSGKIFGRHS